MILIKNQFLRLLVDLGLSLGTMILGAFFGGSSTGWGITQIGSSNFNKRLQKEMYPE